MASARAATGASREQMDQQFLLEARYGSLLRIVLLLSGALTLWSWQGAPRLVPFSDWRPESYILLAYALAGLGLAFFFPPTGLARGPASRRDRPCRA